MHRTMVLPVAKLRKNERNAKGKLAFLFISECSVSSAKPKLRIKENNANSQCLFSWADCLYMEKYYFFSAIMTAIADKII